MFFRPAFPFALALTAALLNSACNRSAAPASVRIAVVPWENLSSDVSLDWIGAAAPYELSARTAGGSPQVYLPARSGQDALALRAGMVLSGYYEAAGKGLRVHLTLRDLQTSRNVREADVEGNTPSLTIAKAAAGFGGRPRASGEPSERALADFGRAVLATSAANRRTLLEQAMKAGPHYGPAAALLAQMLNSEGDGKAAAAVLGSALDGMGNGWDRAQLTQELGIVRHDSALIREGLEDSARFSPANADIARELGAFYVQHHQYLQGISWFRRTVALEPGETVFWNLLAYAQAYGRDFAGARASAAQYRKLAPQDPNAFDTTGEIEWYGGDFAAAGRAFLEAQEKQADFAGGLEFSKAAFARFLAGDVGGADRVFQRYLETRRALKDPLTDVREAHWLTLTRRRAKGLERLAALAKADSGTAAQASMLLAIGLLEEGKASEAAEPARNAAKAGSPAIQAAAGAVSFLAQPPASAADWVFRADRAYPPSVPSNVRRQVLIYALVLGKHYTEAAKLLEAAYAETPPPASEENRMLLARALLETGEKRRASGLLANYPLPPLPGESVFAGLYFPAFLEWRKAAGLSGAS